MDDAYYNKDQVRAFEREGFCVCRTFLDEVKPRSEIQQRASSEASVGRRHNDHTLLVDSLKKMSILKKIQLIITAPHFYQDMQVAQGDADYAVCVDGIKASLIDHNNDSSGLDVDIRLNMRLGADEARDHAESLGKDYRNAPALTEVLQSEPYCLQLNYIEARDVSPNGPTVTELSVHLFLLNEDVDGQDQDNVEGATRAQGQADQDVHQEGELERLLDLVEEVAARAQGQADEVPAAEEDMLRQDTQELRARAAEHLRRRAEALGKDPAGMHHCRHCTVLGEPCALELCPYRAQNPLRRCRERNCRKRFCHCFERRA
mmetsp:Transcript_44432/g.105265  ORF Transcript_44432/g.105265 Transcript_44432/m.105265 type:complete len:318 (+) Transcript_44432:70-1023(+)